MKPASLASPVVQSALDIIDCSVAGTLWGLFCERLRRTPEAVAYRDYDVTAQAWREHSWRAIGRRSDCFRAALAKEGLRPGDRVALLLPNGVDWVAFDLAAHALGLVVVALYPHDSPANHAFILGHSEARLLLVQTSAQWRATVPLQAMFPLLERVWVKNGEAVSEPDDPLARSLGQVLTGDAPVPPAIAPAPGALATLIYTSGTTGQPKGVMLSHFALLWNAEAVGTVVPPRRDDTFLSVLPLAHAFQRTIGYYLPMMGGASVAYGRSPQALREDLAALRPTVLLAVPFLYERMATLIRAKVAASPVKHFLLRFTAGLGWRRLAAAQELRHPQPGERLAWPLLSRLVAAPVLAAFGGRLRAAVSGGAPLDADIARFLMGLGLPLLEGYGLTEAAPVVAAPAIGDNRPGFVGRPLSGVEVKLNERSELMVRTPSLMIGYWKDAAATARAVDDAGWLATGDIAEMHDGRLRIAGRLKEMIVLSIGEKVNPNLVEAAICRDPVFAQVAVVGEGRRFLAALAVLDKAAWQHFAATNGLDPDAPDAMAAKARLLALIEQRTADLPRHAQVRALYVTLEPWTIEQGLLTPTLKIKRDALQRQFAQEIGTLYDAFEGRRRNGAAGPKAEARGR